MYAIGYPRISIPINSVFVIYLCPPIGPHLRFQLHYYLIRPEVRTQIAILRLRQPPRLAMPKPKLPAHLPQAWKYGNRFLEPGLTPALRRLYKDKIVLPEPEPLWSKSIKYGTYLAGGGPQPGRPQRLTLVFFGYVYFIMDHGPVGYSALITRVGPPLPNSGLTSFSIRRRLITGMRSFIFGIRSRGRHLTRRG